MSARRRMTTATITTTIIITATRIIATAIIRASAPSRMSTAPAAATTITTTPITTTRITVTITTMATASAEAATGASCRCFSGSRRPFPVGAFAYSHGLEWAVEAGDVIDAALAARWLADLAAFRRAAPRRGPVRGRASRGRG